MEQRILERWKLSAEELEEIIQSNPSMRGIIFGYVAEYKLRKLWFSDDRITSLRKYDDHDRTRPSDLAVTYKGQEITIEVKSLQTATVSRKADGFSGKFQCDASDRRSVRLPNGQTLQTTCLLAGQFDLLAVNLFAFDEEWRFAFAKNLDLPRSKFRGYTPQQQRYLLATLMEVSWPVQAPFTTDPFPLMEEILREKSRRGPPRA